MNIPSEMIQFHVDMLNDQKRMSSYLAAIREVVRSGDVVVDIGSGQGSFQS